MRKIVVSEFMALDGVFENPGWTMEFGSKEQENFKYEELKAADALLIGRVTYEGFSQAWPNMIEQTGDYGVRMNEYPKYVVSNTLSELSWQNSSLLKGELVETLSKLKQEPGKDILVFGSGQLVNALLKAGQVDEYRVMVFPIVVGNGRRLFDESNPQSKLKLIKSETFASGVVVLTYQPA